MSPVESCALVTCIEYQAEIVSAAEVLPRPAEYRSVILRENELYRVIQALLRLLKETGH